MEIKLSENQLKNLMIFLNRVTLQGLEEVTAMNEILVLLTRKENIE